MDYTPHLTKRIGLFLLVLAAAIMMLTGCGGGGSSSGGGSGSGSGSGGAANSVRVHGCTESCGCFWRYARAWRQQPGRAREARSHVRSESFVVGGSRRRGGDAILSTSGPFDRLPSSCGTQRYRSWRVRPFDNRAGDGSAGQRLAE